MIYSSEFNRKDLHAFKIDNPTANEVARAKPLELQLARRETGVIIMMPHPAPASPWRQALRLSKQNSRCSSNEESRGRGQDGGGAACVAVGLRASRPYTGAGAHSSLNDRAT